LAQSAAARLLATPIFGLTMDFRYALANTALVAALVACGTSAGSNGVDLIGDDAGSGADVAFPDVSDAGNDVGDDAGEGSGESLCEPGENTCIEGRLGTCLATGDGWIVEACADNGTCVEGICVAPLCTPGETLCAPNSVLTCNSEGSGFDPEPCPEGWACFQGDCIECIGVDGCDESQTCIDGLCVAQPLEVVTDELPAGAIESRYDAVVEAEGGVLPYSWSLAAGSLPSGLVLNSNGTIGGTPTATGEADFTVRVTDGSGDTADADLTLEILGAGLQITTDSLPEAEEGFAYDVALAAVGGSAPYAWMIFDGVLPAGLTLTSDGHIIGTPSEIGEFPLTVRVFDRATPPLYDEADFTLVVAIAPLEIVGEQEFNLFITKIITLPLLTAVEGIPLPYNAQLTARGGLRPYHWRETDLPAGIGFLIPRAGIPDGLTLGENGQISGSVTDTSQVVRLTIPLTAIELAGFFFTAEVADSQEPAETRSAIFLIPTIPIGGA
jgi:hypothetical protein